MVRIAKFVLGSLVLLAVACYLTDYALLRLRVARNWSPYGTVNVSLYYAIKEKGGRTEYTPPSEQPQTCVNALFPQMGLEPCWYLRRHTEKSIPV
jgi:hypothetical protein